MKRGSAAVTLTKPSFTFFLKPERISKARLSRCKMRSTFLHKEEESQAHVDIRTAADCTCGIAGPIQLPLDLNKYNSYLLQPTGGRILLHSLRRNDSPVEFTRLAAPHKEKQRSERAKDSRKESENE